MTQAELERTPEQRRKEAVFWSKVCFSVCGVAVCIVFIEMARHAYEWLRFGETEKVSLLDFLSVPNFSWVGVNSILDFIWGLPVWLLAVAITIVSGWLAGVFEEEAAALGTKS